jgi:LmbE family N-acetylglucosaminyl deacetylase
MSKKIIKTILVVAAHPDDEVLGCGGTIAKHSEQGDIVYVLFMSEGVSSRFVIGEVKDWTQEISARETAAINAAKVLGVKDVEFLRYPNLRMRDLSMLDIVKQVESAILKYRPSVIYTHHGGDLNSDHRVTHEAVITACRPIENFPVREIISFEIPSSTEWSTSSIGEVFTPNMFVDIHNFFQKKIEAISCYDMEMRPFPHPRSQRALTSISDRYGSVVGKHGAEAFCILRRIID